MDREFYVYCFNDNLKVGAAVAWNREQMNIQKFELEQRFLCSNVWMQALQMSEAGEDVAAICQQTLRLKPQKE